jgi:methylenetetrahydrofolate dehydrogenase (NADP+)/methenyltetrahydrofolate cyclohydrolase
MERLDGRALSKKWRNELKNRIDRWKQQSSVTPCLAVVLVGDDPASQVYVSHKIKACAEAGIQSLEKRLPGDVSEKTLLQLVSELNADPSVHGILVQLPLPAHIAAEKVIDRIDPLKDADGLTLENLGRLAAGRPRVAPCTPFGVIQLLKEHRVSMTGADAVVIGRSQIVGKPMALLLLQENATVTICHSKTKDLKAHLKKADIVVVAAGRPEFLGREDFHPGTVIVDVGIHRKADGRLCGDVRFSEVAEQAKAITPVPGGVGPMTIAMLLENTFRLSQIQTQGASL